MYLRFTGTEKTPASFEIETHGTECRAWSEVKRRGRGGEGKGKGEGEGRIKDQIRDYQAKTACMALGVELKGAQVVGDKQQLSGWLKLVRNGAEPASPLEQLHSSIPLIH